MSDDKDPPSRDPAAALLASDDAVRRVELVAWQHRPTPVEAWGAGAPEADWVTTEEPLQLSLDGDPIITTMRTPGSDRELALGLLLSEGIIESARDVSSLGYCASPGDEGYRNALDVKLLGAVREPATLGAARRGTLTTSACGVCGRTSIDDLLARCRPLNPGFSVTAAVIASLPQRLRQGQVGFSRTGGVHAAGVGDGEGRFAYLFEDVGRHNAVDKCLGRALIDGRLPLQGHALVVSGRASFEIVQKAIVGGIPIVVSVSAPSSLAVDLATRCNLTLVAFASASRFNVYSAGERVRAV